MKTNFYMWVSKEQNIYINIYRPVQIVKPSFRPVPIFYEIDWFCGWINFGWLIGAEHEQIDVSSGWMNCPVRYAFKTFVCSQSDITLISPHQDYSSILSFPLNIRYGRLF